MSRGGLMMMFIATIIICCITVGAFYTSEKRRKETMENGTLVTIKRERLLTITDKYVPLEKILSTKIQSNGTVEITEKWFDDEDKDLLKIYEELNDE